ncbi:glutaredoxin-like protein [Punctularia strigosozonata HHB-11173 SS5]|uniref:glutaredoxin-like protein n=1 Tax=Punctularia strigosozonata (strain HHB-11173) TaxID=741275 RepID=UPI0004417D5B|nr:glutaredoxin-like protein [Punctularia strigosozonata HHB-11173 SS5]EIN12821.1 glutaredoxin-like protein [Punctularia strigosozonata HHB-11173 SS5]
MSTPPNHVDVNSSEHFQELMGADLNRLSVINFWAPWAAPCEQMNAVCLELAKKYQDVLFLKVEAELQSEISESFDIEAVPSFLVLRGHVLLERISGADAPRLTATVERHSKKPAVVPQSTTDKAPPAPSSNVNGYADYESPEELEKRLRGLMNQTRIMLFMKGNPDQPRCGFSRRAVELLRDQKVEFGSFDILSDESVRSGLKKLNDWPTFPQFVVNGEFIGGLDVVKEMVDNGEWAEIAGTHA